MKRKNKTIPVKNPKKKNDSNKSNDLKKTLINVQRSIRKKFNDLHNEKLLLNERINEEYKPLIQPLNKLVEAKDGSVVKKEKNNHNYSNRSIKKFEPKYSASSESDNTFAGTKRKKKRIRKLLSYEDDDNDDTLKRSVTEKSDNRTDESFYQSIPGTSSFLSSTLKSNKKEKKKKKNERSSRKLLTDDDDDDSGDGDELMVIRPLTRGRKQKDQETERNRKYYTANISGQHGGVFIGNHEVTISTEFISVKRRRFKRTEGLLSLICSENPTNYDDDDLELYKQILILTNAHKQNFERNGKIVRNNSKKYKEIITKLFPHDGTGSRRSTSSSRIVKKLIKPKFMILNKNINYTYWDDANELVDRLRLLVSSRSAGHTAHNNEILSIIDELQEANIIE